MGLRYKWVDLKHSVIFEALLVLKGVFSVGIGEGKGFSGGGRSGGGGERERKQCNGERAGELLQRVLSGRRVWEVQCKGAVRGWWRFGVWYQGDVWNERLSDELFILGVFLCEWVFGYVACK